MKRLRLSIVGGLLIMCFLSSVQAHVGDAIFPFYEITDDELMEIDVSDGSIEDWEEIISEPSVTAIEFSSLPTGGRSEPVVGYDPADLDFRVWLGWNQSHRLLFFGFEAIDNIYINEYDGGGALLSYDSVMFMVDGDHSGGQYRNDPTWTPEERKLNYNRTHQVYEAIAVTPENQHIYFFGTGAGKDWALALPYGDNGGMMMGESPAISVIEFFVTPFDDLLWYSPEESIPSTLSPGKIIGFNIAVYDHDSEPGEYRGVFSLSGEFSAGQYANQFVDGVLVGEGDIETGDTVLESATWGRIKGSFRNW